MPSKDLNLDSLSQAVFSVCASADVAAAILTSCDHVTGSGFIGEFQDYFGGDRQPLFPPVLSTAPASVAVIDCDQDGELALATMKRVRSMLDKNLSIIAVAKEMEAAYVVRAMRAGCNEFLLKPADSKAMEEALMRFQRASVSTAIKNAKTGRLIAFYGVKGGVGTTTLATHVANNLVGRHQKRVLLIDHHHELGHVSLHFGLKHNSQYHFDELIRQSERLDAELLNGFVARHASGLEVLASPDACSATQKSTPDEMHTVLGFLRTQYDYVLVDSSLTNMEITLPIIEDCDDLCLVSTADVAALRDLARRVEYLTLTESTTGKLRIVINRSTADDAVNAEQIEESVHFPVWATVPNNYSELVRSLNAGAPIPAQHRSSFAQQISKFTDKLLPEAAQKQQEPVKETRKRSLFWPSKPARAV